MDTESLKLLIRAAVLAAPLAAPLSACGGGTPPPSRPVVNLDPAPTSAEPETTTSETSTSGTETHASTDGTMDPEEFDRQWRRSLGDDGDPDTQVLIMEGRPLTSAAGPVRAALRAPTAAPIPRIAARWLDVALAEHASVASFARAVMELSALGAPAALLEGHLRAGLDEVKHTELAFSVASRFGAPDRVPGPMAVPPPREARFARLAADTFVEGCVNETIAALMATRAARYCEDPVVRSALEAIAEDEARHAALAWQTVRWAIASDPAARARVASIALPDPQSGAREPELLRHGVLDAHETNRVAREAVDRVIAPLRGELLLG